MSHYKRPRAFTLVELLVVIGIIALLVSILLPTLARARDSAKSVKCGSNARQIATGLIGYAQDHEGTLPIGYTWIGFGNSWARYTNYVGPPYTMEGWVYAASGYLNNQRANGYNMPYTAAAIFRHDPDDNYHPVFYCPQVLSDFDNEYTHYGQNPTLMPCWTTDSLILGMVATSRSPSNMAGVYADNALLWDGQQFKWTDQPESTRTSQPLGWPLFGFNGVDFSNPAYWGPGLELWDMVYRDEEGEDPTAFPTLYERRSAEYPVMIPLPNLGEYWYAGNQEWEQWRGQEDIIVDSNGWFDTDLWLAPIFRHNGKSRCNTAFVDGSVKPLTYNKKEIHPAFPGGPYAMGEMTRQMLRPKWPTHLMQLP